MSLRHQAFVSAFAAALFFAACSAARPAPTPGATATLAPMHTPVATATLRPTVTSSPTPTSSPLPSPTSIVPLHLGWTWGDDDVCLWDAVTGPDGTSYAQDCAGTLYAVAPPGTLLWAYAGEYADTSELLLSPDGSTLYFVADETRLYAVGTDGVQRWTYHVPQTRLYNPTLAPDGSLYLQVYVDVSYTAVDEGAIRVFPDGTSQPFPLPEKHLYLNPDISPQGNLYQVSMHNRIMVLSPDGTLLAACAPAAPVKSRILFGPGDVAIYLDDDGPAELIAQRPDCSVAWKTVIVDGAHAKWDAYYPLALSGAQLYAGGPDGLLTLLDAATGEILWQNEPDPALSDIHEIAPAGDVIYAAGDRGMLLAFDGNGGRLLWSDVMYRPGWPHTLQLLQDGDLVLIQAGKLLGYTHDPSRAVVRPKAAEPPASREAAQQAIADLLLRCIVVGKLDGTTEFIGTSDEPWVDSSPEASLIIYYAAHPSTSGDVDEDSLEEGRPLHVWWYTPGRLVEVTGDKQQAIDEYHEHFVWTTGRGIWEFGIASISDDLRTAEVYFADHCGWLCGSGNHYRMARSPSGKWWVYDSSMLWIS